jgi:hypothetical protein
MSERGFFAIDRGVWDHPLFAREKFSEREAWIWLISSAAWEPTKVRVGRGWFDLARGQCAFALRFMAVKWMWSEPRVRRFLKRLADDAAALVSATREATLITICNYNDYQLSRRTDVPNIDASLGAKPTNPRRKEEETKQSNNQQLKKESPLRVDDWPADFGDAFWQAYPRKTEKLAAMKKLANLRKSAIVTFVDLIAGVHRYAASVANTEPKYIKQPTTWLNAGCWADEIPEGGFNGHDFSNNRANQAAGPAPTRDIAVFAGMGRALERRRAARAADDPGRQVVREAGHPGAAGGVDAEPGSAPDDDGPPRQSALFIAGHTG